MFTISPARPLPILALLVMLQLNLAAQQKIFTITEKYSVSNIADSLLKGAIAVVRTDETFFEAKDENTATMKVHHVVTILNQRGSRYLQFVEVSDKFSKLDEAEIIIYDAMGRKIKTYSKKDMQSTAYGSGLVEDGKYTYFTASAPAYPITIEQNYTTKFTGILDYPDSYLQQPGVSVENFSYIAQVNALMGLRYRVLNSNIKPEITSSGANTSYQFSARNMPAQNKEFNSGPSANYFAKIELAPNKFKMMDYDGSMATWKEFGLWSNKLIGNDNRLSEKNEAFIKTLVGGASTDIEKARVIYNYLQQNMRYVSIQLGIGGWKPFSADFVQEKKYGDCKALSNYMKAALAAVNVPSLYAEVNAGENAYPASDDFPSSPFNHIILCIPQPKDSVWLECTSNTSDFGVLGNFTENRKALLITPAGGVLVNTPKSTARQNKMSIVNTYAISEDWSGKLTSSFSATGEFKEQQIAWMNGKSSDEKAAYLLEVLKWKQPDELNITNGDAKVSPYKSTATAAYEQLYSMKLSSKVFINKKNYLFFIDGTEEVSNRKQDFYFSFPYIKTDTSIMQLPAGFKLETIPANRAFTNDIGRYTSTYQWDTNTRNLTMVTELEIIKARIPAADYPKMLALKDEIMKDSNEKLVLITE